ncbi:hypothetical protein [Anabaena azotica]|uniref:SPOR domain-containing protein n=1 Tax=Anabaena azotica FACHB-119 TaxID=947527 RepID=A0ABR8D352_9NOST|nr:hypothetical protein [Anabaena azotica]MBD2501342.1 hypothetical protein [Anabaena azotica FACHB-119]
MNKFLVTGIVVTILWPLLVGEAGAQLSSCRAGTSQAHSDRISSTPQSQAIVIGKVANQPYTVVVPGKSESLLNLVKNHVPGAFMTQHKLGAYVHAGSFSQRREAECLSRLLRSHRLDARVVYLR